jgi:MFS family permease
VTAISQTLATAPAQTDASHWSAQGIGVMALCFVLNMFDGVNIFTLTFVAPALQSHFHAGSAQFSVVFSAGLVGMGLGGLFVAPLADRLGRRPVILFALALMAGAMLGSAYAPDVWSLAALRLVVGIGIGTVLASITALSAGFAPERWRHVAAGVPQAGYPVGATIAGFATAWALPTHGWAAVFTAAGWLTLLLVPLCWVLLPETPETASRAHHTIAEAIGGGRKRNSTLLWVATIGGFMALYFIASWITKLAIAAGLPQGQAIIASTIYSAGSCLGTIMISFAAMRVDLRKLVFANLALASVLFVVFGGGHLSLTPLLWVCFFIGVTLQGGVNGNYPLAAAVYPADMRATGLGWAMGVGRIGALLGPLIGGWALGAGLPLVWVFGIFCVPMLATGAAAMAINLERKG